LVGFTLTPALSLREREVYAPSPSERGRKENPHSISPLSLREREVYAPSPSERGRKANPHSIGPLSLRERVRVRVTF